MEFTHTDTVTAHLFICFGILGDSEFLIRSVSESRFWSYCILAMTSLLAPPFSYSLACISDFIDFMISYVSAMSLAFADFMFWS